MGKTSLAMSIGRATGRKFVRVSLGGVRDEAEIRGHRRTYIGALPGQIIQMMKKAGTVNPVFVLDEVDKMSMDFRGDPSAALMEVLDPELNHAFTDHYLDVEYDLSKVMFVCTANVLHTIPQPLQDRMEILRLPGYTEVEKREIAKRFLIKKQREAAGLTKTNLQFTDDAITLHHPALHAGSGRAQSGARDCQHLPQGRAARGEGRQDSIQSPSPRRTLTNSWASSSSVNSGPKRRTKSAWPPVWPGPKSAARCSPPKPRMMQGKGRLTLTGKLGDVMQESAQAAMSYVRSRTSTFGLPRDFYRHIDIHVHVPEGAIPKDGPSAGITICHRHRQRPDAHPGALRRGHDRRNHPARQGPAHRRHEGKIAGRSSHGDSHRDSPQGQ